MRNRVIGSSGDRAIGKAAQAIIMALLALPGWAQQSPPESPQPHAASAKELLLLNGVQAGATAFAAAGSWYGAKRCIHESDSRFLGPDRHTPRGEFGKTAAIAGSIDIATAVIAWRLRRRHPAIAAALPLLSAGAQAGVAAMQFSAGCI